MLVKVKLVTTTYTTEKTVDDTTTVAQFYREMGVIADGNISFLDGDDLRGRLGESFAELGVTEECTLSLAAKRDDG